MAKHGIAFMQQSAARLHPCGKPPRARRWHVGKTTTISSSQPVRSWRSTKCPGSDRMATRNRFAPSIMHAKAHVAWEAFCKEPGPIVVGAVQGASCYGPAYEYAMIMDKELRSRKLRDRVPMTFVTSEPYIGHLGLGGVGDTKGLLEHELRQR